MLKHPELTIQSGKEKEALITLSRNRPARGSTCRRCRIIRSFIAFTIMLCIFSAVVGDGVQYLMLITPERAAIVIWIVGGLLFLVKLTAWLRERRATINGDHVQVAQPGADMEKNARRYGL